MWPSGLCQQIKGMRKEILAAIKKEPTVKLSDLGLEMWGKKTGLTELAEKFSKP